MSHFTSIKTQIKNSDILVEALADVGFKQVEVWPEARSLYGFQGDIREQTAEVIVRRKYISSSSNDIGFKRQDDGTFTAIISEYDRYKYSEQWLNRLMQRYGYRMLMATAPAEGFNVEEEETLADGTIRVVVARWT